MATPLDERTYGSAPYEEALAKAKARRLMGGNISLSNIIGRMLQRGALQASLQGLGAVPRGANFGTAFLAAAGGAGRAMTTLDQQQAAEEYRQRQMEMSQSQLELQQQRLEMDAAARAKPEKPTPWAPRTYEEWQAAERFKASLKPAPGAGKAAGAAGQMPEDTGGTLTEEGLDAAARLYSMNGQLPFLGFGTQAGKSRTAIINRAAKLYPRLDIATNAADYAKNKRSLTTQQNLYDAATSWETTALKNAEIVKEAARDIPELGAKFLNMPVRELARQGGSPQVQKFVTALEVVTPEFARLLSAPGATGSAMLTDTARREMRRILSGSLTTKQLLAALDVLARDAHNRRVAYSQQIDQIRRRITWNNQLDPSLNPNINVAGQQDSTGTTGDVIWKMDASGNLVPSQ